MAHQLHKENHMNRCNPVTTRKNLEAAKALSSVGIDYVCIPVTEESSKAELIEQMCKAMGVIGWSEEDESVIQNEKQLADMGK
jgi:hypothetical protein